MSYADFEDNGNFFFNNLLDKNHSSPFFAEYWRYLNVSLLFKCKLPKNLFRKLSSPGLNQIGTGGSMGLLRRTKILGDTVLSSMVTITGRLIVWRKQ